MARGEYLVKFLCEILVTILVLLTVWLTKILRSTYIGHNYITVDSLVDEDP